MAAGPRIVHDCIRDSHSQKSLDLHVPKLFFPVCFSWPVAARPAHEGDGLFTAWNVRKLLEGLRSIGEARS